MATLSKTQKSLVQKLRIHGNKNLHRVGLAVVDLYRSVPIENGQRASGGIQPRLAKARPKLVQLSKKEIVVYTLREVVSDMSFYQYLKKKDYSEKEAVIRSVRLIGKDVHKRLYQLCNSSVRALEGDFDEFWEKLSLVLSN